MHPIIANITAEGDPSAGQNYTLVCGISSGLGGLDPVITYRWTKDNGTRIQIGSDSNILSFSSLRLSDTGLYTCDITMNVSHLVKTISTTFHFKVPSKLAIAMCMIIVMINFNLLVPQPSVSLVSNTSNPILSGSSPLLLCIVELHPTVDVSVELKVVWTSPHGSEFPSNIVIKSFSLYTSKVVLRDIGLADSGLYTCKVNIRNEIRSSVQKDIQIGQPFLNHNHNMQSSVKDMLYRRWYVPTEARVHR